MGSVNRILQYIEYKGVSKYKFYKQTGLSNGFLDKNTNMGTDKCEKIIDVYSDLNAEWLITGKGQMLKSDILQDNSESFSHENCPLQPMIENQQKLIDAQSELINTQNGLIEDLRKQLKI